MRSTTCLFGIKHKSPIGQKETSTTMLPVDTVHCVCEFLHDSRILRSVCRSWAASLCPMWWDGGFLNPSAVGLQPFVQRLLDEIPHATHVTLRLGRSVPSFAEAVILYNLALCLPTHQIETLRLYLLCDGRVGEIQLNALQTIVDNVANPTLQGLALHVNHRYLCRIQGFVWWFRPTHTPLHWMRIPTLPPSWLTECTEQAV